MKKIFTLMILLFIIVSSCILIRRGDSKTIEEALGLSNLEDIIYEEKMDHGSLVFYLPSDRNGLGIAFAEKNLGRYKIVYSGAHGDIKKSLDSLGFTHMFFPAIEKAPFPMYLGIIGNPEISQIKIVEKNKDIEKTAKIVQSNSNYRIWMADMRADIKDLDSYEFEIIGMSENKKEITKFNDNLSPDNVQPIEISHKDKIDTIKNFLE